MAQPGMHGRRRCMSALPSPERLTVVERRMLCVALVCALCLGGACVHVTWLGWRGSCRHTLHPNRSHMQADGLPSHDMRRRFAGSTSPLAVPGAERAALGCSCDAPSCEALLGQAPARHPRSRPGAVPPDLSKYSAVASLASWSARSVCMQNAVGRHPASSWSTRPPRTFDCG